LVCFGMALATCSKRKVKSRAASQLVVGVVLVLLSLSPPASGCRRTEAEVVARRHGFPRSLLLLPSFMGLYFASEPRSKLERAQRREKEKNHSPFADLFRRALSWCGS
jgi:hypothetical protein